MGRTKQNSVKACVAQASVHFAVLVWRCNHDGGYRCNKNSCGFCGVEAVLHAEQRVQGLTHVSAGGRVTA